MSLNDIALVTGARGGIGRALVARLRARGLRVAAVGRDAATLAELLAEARIAADTTTPEGAAAAFAACREQLGAAPSWLAHCCGKHADRATASHEGRGGARGAARQPREQLVDCCRPGSPRSRARRARRCS